MLDEVTEYNYNKKFILYKCLRYIHVIIYRCRYSALQIIIIRILCTTLSLAHYIYFITVFTRAYLVCHLTSANCPFYYSPFINLP